MSNVCLCSSVTYTESQVLVFNFCVTNWYLFLCDLHTFCTFFTLGQGQRNKTGIQDGAPLTMQEISKRQGIPIYIVHLSALEKRVLFMLVTYITKIYRSLL